MTDREGERKRATATKAMAAETKPKATLHEAERRGVREERSA